MYVHLCIQLTWRRSDYSTAVSLSQSLRLSRRCIGLCRCHQPHKPTPTRYLFGISHCMYQSLIPSCVAPHAIVYSTGKICAFDPTEFQPSFSVYSCRSSKGLLHIRIFKAASSGYGFAEPYHHSSVSELVLFYSSNSLNRHNRSLPADLKLEHPLLFMKNVT